MKAKIVFSAAIFLAVLAVILLALLSPSYHTSKPQNSKTLSLSLYLQQSLPIGASTPQPVSHLDATGAIIFHRALTEGPTNTSRPVGRAQGFIIPIERFAHSAFNIIHLSFDTAERSGSLSVRVDHVAGRRTKEELKVVGGTGCFAFARGVAVFAEADRRHPNNIDATHLVKLQLNFPKHYKTKF